MNNAYRGLGNLANEKMAALEPGQWIAVFSAYDDYNDYTELFGETICSARNGNNHNGQYGGNVSDWTSDETTLTNASGERRYCWCRVTGYKPNGGQMCNANSSVWVFVSDEGIMDGDNLYNMCSNECSEKCGYTWAAYNATKRNILLSVIE